MCFLESTWIPYYLKLKIIAPNPRRLLAMAWVEGLRVGLLILMVFLWLFDSSLCVRICYLEFWMVWAQKLLFLPLEPHDFCNTLSNIILCLIHNVIYKSLSHVKEYIYITTISSCKVQFNEKCKLYILFCLCDNHSLRIHKI